jgi:hypothetical protein
MSISNYLEAKILDHVLRGAANAYTAPSTIYLALHTGDPTDAGGTSTEVSNSGGSAYGRQTITFNAASAGTIAASAAVEFTNMPTATVTHVALWDSSSGSTNLLWSGELATHRTVALGDSLRVTSLSITLD